MPDKTPITVAYGDGIGPEMPEVIEIGEKIYRDGHSSGIKPDACGAPGFF